MVSKKVKTQKYFAKPSLSPTLDMSQSFSGKISLLSMVKYGEQMT
jgi:hypothetical protein